MPDPRRVGIDDALLANNIKNQVEGEELFEMMNGCICCTVRADLAVVLKKLKKTHESGKPIEAIVIETTGMADPAPVAQTFFVDDEIASFCQLDGIVTLVDAKHIVQHLDEEKPEGAENESVEQVAFADRLILNKCDLVPKEEDLKAVETRLRSINKFAPIVRSTKSEVSPDQVLGIGAFDLKRTLEMDPEFLDTEGEHEHDNTVSSIGINLCGNQILRRVRRVYLHAIDATPARRRGDEHPTHWLIPHRYQHRGRRGPRLVLGVVGSLIKGQGCRSI